MAPQDQDSWPEWKKLVLDKLTKLDDIGDRLTHLHLDLELLKQQSRLGVAVFGGFWGLVAGCIPVILHFVFLK